MMKSALLFYRKLVKELKEMGFEINPYDPCVANKLVDEKQMTVRWHVDDLMISHVNKGEILKFVRCIKDIYGDNLVENVGKVHDYLGMTFDYAFGGEVRINMCKYLSSIIADFPEQITGVSATPAADHLFKVRGDGKKLSEEQADAFHHTVYQLLFAANRARRDIQTAVSFLTTRVQAPDEDDWGKLKRVLKYLNGTRYLKLILSADAMNFAIHWYIDGSHQIHKDCPGQTGSLVIFGAGAVLSSLNKQKSNTKSSTETEIIALHDKLSDVIWMRYFVECQGYTIDECIIFQDNMSALSLEKSGGKDLILIGSANPNVTSSINILILFKALLNSTPVPSNNLFTKILAYYSDSRKATLFSVCSKIQLVVCGVFISNEVARAQRFCLSAHVGDLQFHFSAHCVEA